MATSMWMIRKQQIGFLKVIECLAAIIFVAGALAWGWYLTLSLWLILVALPSTVLRIMRIWNTRIICPVVLTSPLRRRIQDRKNRS